MSVAVNSNRAVAGADGKPRDRRDLNIHYYLPTLIYQKFIQIDSVISPTLCVRQDITRSFLFHQKGEFSWFFLVEGTLLFSNEWRMYCHITL